MNKSIYVFFVLIFFCSCTAPLASSRGEDYCYVWQKIENQYVKDMKLKYGAEIFGAGGSFMSNISRVYLNFRIYREVKVDEARVAYVNAMLDLQKRINSSVQLRSDLNHYPFPVEDIGLQLSYFKKGHEKPERSYVGLSCLQGSMLVFFFRDPKTNMDGILHREPFVDAVEIVRKQGLLEHDVD